jgi:hypothetical protein
MTCGDPARLPGAPSQPAGPGATPAPTGGPPAGSDAPAGGGGGFAPGLLVGLVVGGGVAILVAGMTVFALRRWA